MKKMIAFSLVLALVVILLPLKTATGDEGEYGIFATNNGVEMYKDVHGNLHSIVIGPNGEKEVVLSRYEEAPLEALIKRDAKESKGKSALPEDILRKFYLLGVFLLLHHIIRYFHQLFPIISDIVIGGVKHWDSVQIQLQNQDAFLHLVQ